MCSPERIITILKTANIPLQSIDIARIFFLMEGRDWNKNNLLFIINRNQEIDWKNYLKNDDEKQKRIKSLKYKILRLEKYIRDEVEYVMVRGQRHWCLKINGEKSIKKCIYDDCARYEDHNFSYIKVIMINQKKYKIEIEKPFCKNHYILIMNFEIEERKKEIEKKETEIKKDLEKEKEIYKYIRRIKRVD